MHHIAIAGAGIGGLAAALALADPSRAITIYERTAVLREVGAGLQLSPNACAVLRDLGVLDEVTLDAVALDALRIGRGRDGAPLARLPLGAAARHRYGAPFLVTRRADLHEVLRRRVEASPHVTLVTAAHVSGWSLSGGALRLDIDGSRIPSIAVDALIGADGLHSAVRAALAREPRDLHQRGTAWRGTIEVERVPAPFREPCSNLWLGSGAHVVHYPVARGRLINVVASIDGPSVSRSAQAGGWSAPGDPAEIAARFSTWAEPIRRLIGAAEVWNTWPLLDRPPLGKWSKGPVTLLGDAAHPMLPFLAQGAAQALEDAAAIGLAVTAHPGDLRAAFRLYGAMRRGRASRVQKESRRQAMIYHLASPASMVRDVVLRATPTEKLLARYDWLYAPAAGTGRALLSN